ncbi:MAG TPA: Fe-S cluster assembly protein SufD [bacterium]|nr:Fe-S cluster assembly protein SufD [bacterium]
MTVDLAKAQADYLPSLTPPTPGPAWLQALRRQALEKFKELGFPTTKGERWKYTDLSLYLSEPLKAATAQPLTTRVLDKLKSEGWDTARGQWMVFLDGFFSKEQSRLSPVKGLEIAPLADRLGDPRVEAHLGLIASFGTDAFTAAGLSAFGDGAFVAAQPGLAPAETVHLVFVSARNAQAWVRNLLLAGADSRMTVVEHFLEEGVAGSWHGSATEIDLAEGAQVSHFKVQGESRKNLHWGRVAARQQAGSLFTSRVFSFGGRMVRNETETLLAGKRAKAELDGLFLARAGQHLDNQTFIDHAVPQCACQETYKGVLDGDGVGVFDGRVLVRENAQKTDARQSNKNLLLSKAAKVYSKPQLQIYADDVKCSHGSATGQLDEEALFYLRARGIGKQEARQLLVEAFAGELVERVEAPEIREPLARAFQNWFKGLEASHGA